MLPRRDFIKGVAALPVAARREAAQDNMKQLLEAEYRRLGYDEGYAFMGTPEARLVVARDALVTLNPRADGDIVKIWDNRVGNSYLLEKWSKDGVSWNPLQVQLDALWTAISVNAGADVIAATFVPFKSKDWASLARKAEALAFSRDLWRWVLDRTSVTRFFCLGNVATEEMVRLTGATLVDRFPTGWKGKPLIATPAATQLIIRVPHLSRFRVFNRRGHEQNAIQAIRDASTP